MTRTLLVHINPMHRYSGFADDDDPRKMRLHNPRDLVHERYNFKVAPDHKVYGAWCETRIKLNKIDPNVPPNSQRVDKVLVIFWATFPGQGQRVAGWYKNATVWASSRQNSADDRDQNDYIAESRESVLMRAAARIPIPLASQHSGRYGVGNHYGHWYPFEQGERKDEPWLARLLERIDSYKTPVLHFRPDLQQEDQFAEDAATQFAKEQGYLSDSKVRKAIEEYAVKRAIAFFEARGFHLVRKLGKPFDLLFKKNAAHLFVEVKGTQTDGRRIFLTPNEVACSHSRHPEYCLFVLHSVRIPDFNNPLPREGEIWIKKPFRPAKNRLRPVVYSYSLEDE